MARQKSPKAVAEVKSKKTGTVITVFMNPNTLKFSAEFEGEKFEADGAQEVKDWAQKKADEDRNIRWEQIIQASINDMSHPRSDSGDVSFNVKRFWVGRTNSGKLLHATWDVAEVSSNHPFRSQEEKDKEAALNRDDRLLRGSQVWDREFLPENPAENFVVPLFVDRSNRYSSTPPMVFLPYSARLWAVLMIMGSGINSLAKKIDVAIRQPEAAEVLESLSNLVAISVGSVEGSSYYQRAELLRLYDTLSTYYEADKRVELKVDYDYSEEEMDQIGVVVELVIRTSGTGLIAITVYDPDEDPHTPPVDTVLDWMTPAEGVEKMRAELDAFAEKDPTFPG